jgi:uncharacterized protein HemX
VINDVNKVKAEAARKSSSLDLIVLSLLAFVLAVVFGVYETIPVKQRNTTAPVPKPDPTSQAIRDIQTSLQQVFDQLKAIQQTVSTDEADMKRLSGQLNGLSVKFEALQQSFASTHQAPAPVTTEPELPKPKRGSR